MTSFEWFAQQVPQGWFLCALCYEAKPVEQAWTDEHGDRWEVCATCSTTELAVIERRAEERAMASLEDKLGWMAQRSKQNEDIRNDRAKRFDHAKRDLIACGNGHTYEKRTGRCPWCR